MKSLFRYVSCLTITILLFVAVSCTIETYTTKKIAADLEIELYIADNELDVKPNSSGFVFIPLSEGDGTHPKEGDKVAFHYNGYFLNGEIFDTSYDKSYPLIVELGSDMIIIGLEEALKLMDKGGKAKVIIPFYLAYNDLESAPVPPYSNLIFEIELIDFVSKDK